MVAGLKYPGYLACWAAVVVGGLCAHLRAEDKPSVPSPEALSDEHVVNAINRGLNFLIADLDKKLAVVKTVPAERRGDPRHLPIDTGETMLEAYALLHVGKDMKDNRLLVHTDRVKFLLEFLSNFESNSTYTTALQTLALAQLPNTPAVRRALGNTSGRLINGRIKDSGYGYVIDNPVQYVDQSNSQYAMLGVWAAADWGVTVPGSYWTGMNDYWRKNQHKNGGWSYKVGADQDAVTPSMTAAGVASLFVCDEFLNRVPRSTVREDPAIDNGLAAMVAQLKLDSEDFYYLYGVERVALATGKKFFGQQEWYRTMAVNILKHQKADGSFESRFLGSNSERSTCYAILLLARGRAPVLMNKLQYDGAWNLRPRDSANVHAQAAKTLERIINWQTVPLNTDARQWLDTPILLITGSKDPNFAPEDVAKLRQFVRMGGIVFSMSDLDSEEFTAAAKKYALQMYDIPNAPETLFRQLPEDHPLFTASGRMENPPKLFGVTNGVREMWIHCPTDYGAIWQSRVQNPKEAWELPVMLFTYAAGKEELRSKLQSLAVPPPIAIPINRPVVAQLAYNGNWNPEPEAWPRLSKLMASRGAADLQITEVMLKDLGAMPALPAMAHLAGTGKLVLTAEEQKALQNYVNAGGTLFVEALGGNQTFATSAGELLKTLFPQAVRKLVPAEYFLYTGDFSPLAAKIKSVKYRRYWVLQNGNQTNPRLEYLTINKRVGVFFSGEDVTSGLLGTDTWGINGYMPDSSVAIAWNLVLYAARNAPKPKPVASRPAPVQPGSAATGK